MKEKSFAFSVRIVNLYKFLSSDSKAKSLANQILRCGTSIGANVEEAVGAVSRKDFTNMLSIAYKEARETNYWLRLLKDTGFINGKMYSSIESDCTELCKLLFSIIRSSKNK